MDVTPLRHVLHAVFPPQCPGCGTCVEIDHRSRTRPRTGVSEVFCDRCSLSVQTPISACPLCSEPHPSFLDRDPRVGLCRACATDPPPWQWALSAFELTGAVRDATFRCKQPNGAWVCHKLVDLMDEKILQKIGGTALVPIPLHPSVEGVRGFNQAREIARAISASTNAPVVPALRRARLGLPQKKLGRADRRANVAGAFRVTRRAASLAGHPIVLVDDVITTTATMRAAAAALLKANLLVSGVLSLAREA